MSTDIRVTWLRTSCLLIEAFGKVAITDPWFGSRMWGIPVRAKPGIALADLPKVDYVFASHLHPDHFDPDSVSAFGHSDLEIVGTLGTRDRVSKKVRPGAYSAVHDLWHWDEVQLGPFRVIGTPAVHTGPAPPEINLVIDCGDDFRIFFGGDARWSSAYSEIAERFAPIDLALLPIGGTLIFGHRVTMNPKDALRACRVLEPRWAIPIHEGGEWTSLPPASLHPGRCVDFERLVQSSSSPTQALRLARGEPVVFSEGRAHRGSKVRAS